MTNLLHSLETWEINPRTEEFSHELIPLRFGLPELVGGGPEFSGFRVWLFVHTSSLLIKKSIADNSNTS